MDITTVEQLEDLATQLEGDETRQRARLLRLCRAYARILAARTPDAFAAMPRHHGDEAGFWDISFPPAQEYTEHTGPRAIELRTQRVEDIATESGFYFRWRRVTSYGGLYLGLRGEWLRLDETGTGRVGQFAAHPGDCDVDCAIAWTTVEDDDLTLDELAEAERAVRAMAFPLSTAAA